MHKTSCYLHSAYGVVDLRELSENPVIEFSVRKPIKDVVCNERWQKQTTIAFFRDDYKTVVLRSVTSPDLPSEHVQTNCTAP